MCISYPASYTVEKMIYCVCHNKDFKLISLGACNKKAVHAEREKKETDEEYRKNFQKIIAYKIHNKV